MYKTVGDQEIKVHGNAIARPPFLQSGVPRPQRALFPWECSFPGWKDSFIHNQWTSQSEFGQYNG